MNNFWKEGPSSLEEICLELIKDECICGNNNIIVDNICRLPGPVVESIFQHLAKCGAVTNLHLQLFHKARKAPPEKLHLCNVGKSLNIKGLSVFSSYKLRDITLHFDKGTMVFPEIADLLEVFKGSENSLRTLKLYLYPATFPGQGHLFDFVTKFHNLEVLTLHMISDDNDLDDDRWLSILKDLPCLKMLEIFCPRNKSQLSLDSVVFSEHGHRLEHLSLPSLFNSSGVLAVHSGVLGFLDLSALTHLDISVDDDPDMSDQDTLNARQERHVYLEDFMNQLEDKETLPNILSLDLSGWKCLRSENIRTFLDSHQKLWFLGLCLLDVDFTKEPSVVEKWKVRKYLYLIENFVKNQNEYYIKNI